MPVDEFISRRKRFVERFGSRINEYFTVGFFATASLVANMIFTNVHNKIFMFFEYMSMISVHLYCLFLWVQFLSIMIEKKTNFILLFGMFFVSTITWFAIWYSWHNLIHTFVLINCLNFSEKICLFSLFSYLYIDNWWKFGILFVGHFIVFLIPLIYCNIIKF